MLDQSFSAENFRIIIDYENRKGVHLEEKLSIDGVKEINYQIKDCSVQINTYKKQGRYDLVEEIYQKKKELREKKDLLLEKRLTQVSELISDKSFKIELNKIDILGGKPLYTILNIPEHFFALRQVQRNISRLYKVKQANRNQLISQFTTLLNNEFPKIVVRTDIKGFYESLNQDILKRILNNNLLTPLSKKITFDILRSYSNLSNKKKGVPRGIGLSAYLAELYMRDVDRIFKNIAGVSFYGRYVDDIIIIFTPKPSDLLSSDPLHSDMKKELKKILTQ